MNTIECIARAIIEEDGKFLLCRGRNISGLEPEFANSNWFFPGGHIEEGESAPEALMRELVEELGEESEVVRFLGASENKFEKDGRAVHEINLVFEVALSNQQIRGSAINLICKSQEDHLEFAWLARDELRDAIVLPASLRDAVLAMDGNLKPFWVSEGF